jgi:hypothetical protein
MQGGLTHPPREPFGPTSLRWSNLSPAGRKEGGRSALSIVDWRGCRVGGLTLRRSPSDRLRFDGRPSGRPEEGWGIGWRKGTGVDAWRVDSPSKGVPWTDFATLVDLSTASLKEGRGMDGVSALA